MAKLPEGIFGPIIGKIGPLVGARWKGIHYVRSVPYKSNKPPTAAQINNNERFKFINQFLMPFQPFFSIGLSNIAKNMTPLNAAYAINHREAVLGTFPDLSVNYEKLKWAVGLLSTLNHVQFNIAPGQLLKITWQYDHHSNASFDDQVMLLIYCPELKIVDGILNGVRRADNECEFLLEALYSGQEIHIYTGIISSNRKKTANSQYLGSLQVP